MVAELAAAAVRTDEAPLQHLVAALAAVSVAAAEVVAQASAHLAEPQWPSGFYNR
jgi:hypothetical protein